MPKTTEILNKKPRTDLKWPVPDDHPTQLCGAGRNETCPPADYEAIGVSVGVLVAGALAGLAWCLWKGYCRKTTPTADTTAPLNPDNAGETTYGSVV